jgi:hypothetical protein
VEMVEVKESAVVMVVMESVVGVGAELETVKRKVMIKHLKLHSLYLFTIFYTLLYKEVPCNQMNFIFEITEYNYISTNSYFVLIMTFVYLQFLYMI